ncbi:MAG: PSD1 and planctomycete cytochrome C domain-containing protein [Planctomycetota bacterium]
MQASPPTTPARLSLALASAVLAPVAWGQEDVQEGEAIEFFEAKVRPVLAEHCVECHSGDDPKGDLRLDSVEGIAAGVDGESIFEAGDVESSLIVEAVRYDDVFIAMPPSGKLADDEIAAIERWIELGAHLPESIEIDASDALRWCFRPPVDAAAPDVGRSTADPVDAFLLEALAERGVEPSAPADRRAWLRRVTFDLTGLPPSADEIAAFEADGRAGARERVVDRLLASPAFGERWARRWLDLVRYAETKAHEFDYPIPNAHRYRDYVIRAFEADVPYDRFLTELLAGDLVETQRLDPSGTWDESVLGTGAWQLGEEVHSPVEPRGDQTDRIAHQVEVLSKSVLALGVACARCHDHKFDPISAEDYHALAGFALSTAPRQVRFESHDRNAAVARDLHAWLSASQANARAAVADALEEEADGLGATLLHARAVLATDGEGSTSVTPLTAESVRALDELVGARLDLLVEDFEGEAFDACRLAPWTREGEAFAERPIRRADVPGSQDGLVPRGEGCVNSYAGHPDTQGFSADRFTGTLTSSSFVVVRRYLHFLVDGGDEESVRIELVDAATDEVLRKESGRRRNELGHASWDLDELQDREVRIRFVDEHEGGWGQIGGDHFVLSDDDDAGCLDRARTVGQWSALVEADGAPSRRTLAWGVALSTATDRRLVSEWLGWLDGLEDIEAASDVEAGGLAVHRYAVGAGAGWITNGPGFGPGPRDEGDVVLDLEDGSAVVAAIVDRPAALHHPMWADLRLVESSTNRGSRINWVQAGHTVVSPELDLETGRVAHLVRGKGRILLSIASHKLVAGPLHQRSVLRFDTGNEWRWVIQDVPSGAGLSAHVELSSVGGIPCAIAETRELESGAPAPLLAGASWAFERFLDEEHGQAADEAALAAFVEMRLRDAAELVRRGAIEGRSLSDDERRTLYAIAEFVAQEIPSVRARVATGLEEAANELAALEERRVLDSRLAPAALDMDGRDERVLDRGSWRTPRESAARRLPSVLRSSDAPLAGNGQGSGRLALAKALMASETAIAQRVWVNRTWQALFGSGLVSTTDDFGAMGSKPTHPELLDRLALDFTADGWSTKRLVRRLVLTDAYARSTRPTASAAELDPTNELLGHMRIRRLEAEEVRDTLLAVSGELDRTRYGRSIPIHLTPFMTGRGRPGESGPLDGDRRRSIYIEVRRNFPHPLLAVFDQPSPSTCHGRRTSANVPAQALALWNDPFVEGRAEALAGSLDRTDVGAAVDVLWQRVLGRAPRADEGEIARAHVASADDLSPWVDLAHSLFNTKEFLYLE